MNLNPEHIFGAKGPLSKKLPYFEFRPSQIEYAEAVRNVITSGKIALLEAQTGTGKTLAYLIPAIESGKRVLISTGTKALQEQLYHKDIPILQKKLGLQFSHVLMKGRTNYLCLLKYERAQLEPTLPDKESVRYFEEIRDWVPETDTGDISESPIAEDASLWKTLTISADACLGAKCRHYTPCFITRLKQRVEQAQIIIVNHHLFFADLSLQITNSYSIFPTYDIVIFDEAHQLAEVATHNLSLGFSERGVRELFSELARELQILRVREKQDVSESQNWAHKLNESISNLFDKFTTLPQKLRYDENSIGNLVQNNTVVVNERFNQLLRSLLNFVDKTEDMPQLYRRLAAAQSSLAFLLQGSEDAYVYWAERNDTREWTLQASPLDVSGALKKSLWPNLKAAVLTSATLFIDKDSGKVKEELGIQESLDHKFPYNFDYPAQTCLYIPKHLPEPTAPQFADLAAEEICKLVKLTDGGAFVLCTSFNNMRVYERYLRQLDHQLLVQGTRSKQTLLKSFLKDRGSVLLATMSFWQGIDVQGDALVSVIIDKLPFAVPTDPLMEARIQYLRKQKKDPFMDYQLPAAVMMLKQGLGRLIRTSVDYGLLAVLDRRILTKMYGKAFLRNLPSMPMIHKLDLLEQAFLERREKYLHKHLS
jgi:ATP-dependent DNA helicase DinG